MRNKNNPKVCNTGIKLLLIFCFAFFALFQSAHARVVGIVFDDSGSMSSRIHLPAFGAQVLVSSLDGRHGKDRLFTMRLSQVLNSQGMIDLPSKDDKISSNNVNWYLQHYAPLPTEENIQTHSAQQQVINKISRQWTNTKDGRGTPYHPVEMMLKKLSKETNTGEKAYLIIISDGEFNSGLPSPDILKKSYEKYKKKFRGTLRVEFLQILPQDKEEKHGLLNKINKQKVRNNLLLVFNKSIQDGSYNVETVSQLWSKLQEIIANVSSTDRKSLGNILKKKNKKFLLKSPLSISRIISASVVRQSRKIPKIISQNFKAAETILFDSKMLGQDRNWNNKKLKGATTHFRFHPALPPNTYSLSYNAPIKNNVMLLFETQAAIQLSVFDENNKQPPLHKGVLQLVRGKDYKLQAVVIDRLKQGKSGVVPLSSLSNKAKFTAWIENPTSSSKNITLQRNNSQNAAFGTFKATDLGLLKAHASLRLPGFVTPTSSPLKMFVSERKSSLDVKITSVSPCPSCKEGEIVDTLKLSRGKSQSAQIDITYHGSFPDKISTNLLGAPNWLSLTTQSGKKITSGTTFSIKDKQTISLFLSQNGKLIRPEHLRNATTFQLRAKTLAIPTVQITKNISLSIKAPNVNLIARGHTKDPSGQQPLILTGTDLEENATQQNYALDFILNNAGDLAKPELQNFEVYGGNSLISFLPVITDNKISIYPKTSWWCLCGIGFYTGKHKITLQYRDNGGFYNLKAAATIDIQPSWNEILWGCLKILLLLILIGWFLMAIYYFLKTRIFPKNSMLKIDDETDFPRYVNLHQQNWTVFKVLLWPILRSPPNERRNLEGIMLLEARFNGADLIIKGSSDQLYMQIYGQTIFDIVESSSKTQRLRLNWGDTLEDQENNITYTIIKDNNLIV